MVGARLPILSKYKTNKQNIHNLQIVSLRVVLSSYDSTVCCCNPQLEPREGDERFSHYEYLYVCSVSMK